jgi:pimeloyl-ACP methyl ester carboxylesterase
MSTFGLVHGGWHGAWAWEALGRELEGRGHRAVAVDLPCDDPGAGLARYAEVVEAALGDAHDVVLVGHSLGGLTIPLVAARRPASRLVYLCGVLPDPGRSLRDQLAAEGIFVPGFPATERDELARSYWASAVAATASMYADCPPETAAWAFARLRPQAGTTSREPFPLDRVPDLPVTSIVCSDDRAVDPAWSRRAARERLGVEPLELPGGHSPMLSRPAALAELLLLAS